LILTQAQNHPVNRGYNSQCSLPLAVHPPVNLALHYTRKVIWKFKLSHVKYNLPKGDLVEIGHPKISCSLKSKKLEKKIAILKAVNRF